MIINNDEEKRKAQVAFLERQKAKNAKDEQNKMINLKATKREPSPEVNR